MVEPSNFKHPASSGLLQFLRILEGVYGMYVDCCMGLHFYSTRIEQITPKESLDAFMIVGAGSAQLEDTTYSHASTIREAVDRMKRDGTDELFLSRACIVLVYSLWDGLRPLYAELVGRPQNDVRSDVFGDLRLYRNAITHNNGILEKAPVALRFIKMGDTVQLTSNQMRELFDRIFVDVNAISVQCTGDNLNRPFAKPLK